MCVKLSVWHSKLARSSLRCVLGYLKVFPEKPDDAAPVDAQTLQHLRHGKIDRLP